MSKLTYEDKISLYTDKKKGMSIGSLSNKYKVRKSVINYLTALIDKHGIGILRTSKNRIHTKYEKQEAINRVLINGEAKWAVKLDIGLLGKGRLDNWIKNYKENCYNIVERNFNADKSNQKWYTDVTEFNLRGEKIYLSPILDGFNGEVISYNTSKSPNLEQINDMLNKAFDGRNLEGLIFHSDQGWQYQHQSYHQRLKNKGIKQSMSRKGNSMDNGMMENFFGLLKTEMFYDQEDKYKNIDELILAIDDYINYYNYDRIKVKLKGLSPVNYRLQSSN